MNAVTSKGARSRLPLIALIGSTAVSETGNVLAAIAIPWFVLQTTGSAAQTGLVGFFSLAPVVVAGLVGGALVDRVGFKRMSVAADVASGASMALIPLLYYTVGLAFWQLLALVFLGALLDAPGSSARASLLPDVADAAGISLERANASSQGIRTLASLLGPVLVGVLIVSIGTANVLWLNAASFAVSAALIGLAVPTQTSPIGARELDSTRSYAGDAIDGLRFIFRDRLVLAIALTATLINAFGAALGAVILPVYAEQALGSAVDLGLLFASLAAGTLIGITLYGIIGPRLPRRESFIIGLIASGLPMWLLAGAPGIVLSCTALLFMGIVGSPVNPISSTILQERVPRELRGRVFGAIRALAYAAGPLGTVATGFLIEGAGLVATLLVIAAVYLVGSLTTVVNPYLRSMDTPRLASNA